MRSNSVRSNSVRSNSVRSKSVRSISVRSKSVRLRTRVLEKACAQKVCARKSVRSKKERAERILTIFGGNFEMDLKSKRSSLLASLARLFASDFPNNVEDCVLLMLCLSHQYRSKLTIRMKVPANSARNSLAGCDLILIIVDILKSKENLGILPSLIQV